MADTTRIKLLAQAAQLKIEGYRRMSTDELRQVIAKAERAKPATGKPAKGKAAPATTNGKAPTKGRAAKGKGRATKGKAEVSRTPTKGKASGQAAPAKSRARKSTARKPSAAQGRASRAASKAEQRKPRVERVAPRGKALAPNRANPSHRATIDRKAIDWRAESNVGSQGGKRGDVMAALRKFKGDYDKVFEELKSKAKSYYKGKSEHEAQLTLRWLINRVAFDFVMATGQHEMGRRAAYGTATDAINTKRRAERAAANGKGKPARATRATAGKGKAKPKPTSPAPPPAKPAKGKGAGARRSPARGTRRGQAAPRQGSGRKPAGARRGTLATKGRR